MRVGVGLGPNGQFGPVIMAGESISPPESYHTCFKTPEGVIVDVTYNTDNKLLADTIELDVINKCGWQTIITPEKPASRFDNFISAIGIAYHDSYGVSHCWMLCGNNSRHSWIYSS